MQRLFPLIAALVAIAAASSAGAEGTSWKSFNTMKVFVGDDADFSSQVFRGGRYFLALPSDGSAAYVLSLKDQSVFAVDKSDAIDESGTPGLSTETLESREATSTFEKQGGGKWLVWSDGDRQLSLRPKPALIGAATLAQVLDEKPAYRDKADAYEPAADAIASLKAAEEVKILVAFGTWCSTCADWLPRYIKTLEAVGEDTLPTTFISVDAEIEEPAELLAQYKVDAVPTFIVMKNGSELARLEADVLEANPDEPLETRIATILNDHGS
jgi:thiol-disulfide isomerase/thioredoxin